MRYIRNRLAIKLVMLKVYNVKLSFDIWLVLYIYFILYLSDIRSLDANFFIKILFSFSFFFYFLYLDLGLGLE